MEGAAPAGPRERQSWRSRWPGLCKHVPSVLNTSSHWPGPPDPIPGLPMGWCAPACPTFWLKMRRANAQLSSCNPPYPPAFALPFSSSFTFITTGVSHFLLHQSVLSSTSLCVSGFLLFTLLFSPLFFSHRIYFLFLIDLISKVDLNQFPQHLLSVSCVSTQRVQKWASARS